jgi:hypothetical protein
VVGNDRHEPREERVTHRNGPGPAPSTLRWGISSCGSRSAALGRAHEKPSQTQCLILFLPAHQCQKSSDVMGQSGQSLGDRPEAVDPHAGALAVAMGVFPELGVSEPVPGVLDQPAVAKVLQQCLGCGVRMISSTGLPSRTALAAHRQDRGASCPVIQDPGGSGHASQAASLCEV